MRSMRIQCFLSCSFAAADKDVVDFFTAICRGLDIQCVNVDKGYVAIPPEKAKEMIRDSHLLIAIATRRDQLCPNVYSMPKAVDQEMSMAYASNVPIMLFAETEVDTLSGFVRNYCTFQEFDRAALLTTAFLEKAIGCIHGAKVAVISPQQLELSQQGQGHLFSERTRWLVELVDLGGNYTWRYSQTRRLRFTERFTEPIKACAWAAVSSKGSAPADIFKWSFTVVDGTKQFQIKPVEEKRTHDFCEVSIELDPNPEANDMLEYSSQFESPFLNPIYIEDLAETHPSVTVGHTKFLCYDGVIPIVRVQELKVQMRFPPSFPLRSKDFVQFVGSYTNKVDYIVTSEMNRMTFVSEEYGGHTVLELTVQSPLLRHIYGFAWNPPKHP